MADATALGAVVRKDVWVQVPPSAQTHRLPHPPQPTGQLNHAINSLASLPVELLVDVAKLLIGEMGVNLSG